MINILIVDDEPEKVRLLTQCLLELQFISISDVHVSGDVVSAKRQMKSFAYDLLILDINLPLRSDRPPVADGGLALIEWMQRRGRSYAPRFIIGTSAYDDAFQGAKDAFANYVWSLVPFHYDDVSWRTPLKNTVGLIHSMTVPPYRSDGFRYRSDLGIVVALENEELQSVLNLPGEWSEIIVEHDSSRYFKGVFRRDNTKLDVVVAAAPNKGMPFAAVTATKLIYSFWPKYLSMPGICAGFSGRTNMCDVIFADPCWDWGSGKVKPDGERDRLHPAPYQLRLHSQLRNKILSFKDDLAWLRKAEAKWAGPRPENEVRVLIAGMASGASVLGSARAMDDLLEQNKDICAVEMEVYSVLCAAEYGPDPRPIPFAIKSVCDFGDINKGDSYHDLAAYLSATALYEFALFGLVDEGAEDEDTELAKFSRGSH